MARQGITKEQVYQAATSLRDEGIAPTVQTIRERLGTGSFSTISNHLSTWKTETAKQAVADIPPIPKKVMAAFHQTWALAIHSAEKNAETERQAFDAMRREIEKEKKEMSAEITRLEKRLEEEATQTEKQQKSLEKARQENQNKEHQLTEFRIENARLDERSKAAEIRASELKKQFQTLEAKIVNPTKT